jgi:hypothetical protein
MIVAKSSSTPAALVYALPEGFQQKNLNDSINLVSSMKS